VSLFGAVVCLLASVAVSAQADPDLTVVHTAAGALRGQIVGDVASFKGVPFAAPPVGPLRWREPAPVQTWPGVRSALDYGPPCAQAASAWNRAVAAQSREDCLYLNVWAPARRKGAALPVMVFFPGGAYHGGSARGLSAIEPSYDGGKLAQRGVIVVTANYRLGMFGFLAHPELTSESPRHASGNYALMDNIAALNWVKANIGRFGGDPRNVTAFGHSAGSASVGFLMTSPLARGLFAKAIFESNTVVDGTDAAEPTLKEAEAAGAAFARGLGAPSSGAIAELRRRPAQDLLTTMLADPSLRKAEPRDPDVDGYVLTEQAALVFQAAREAAIPLIVGSAARDGDFANMGVSGNPNASAAIADAARPLMGTHKVAPLTPEGARAVQAFYAPYGDLAGEAARVYGAVGGTDPAQGDVLTAFDTDYRMRCGASLIARWHAGIAPTWQYEFSHGYEPLGAVHLWDIMYVFGWLQPPADQPRDADLADQIQQYWVTFARTGNPNGSDQPYWPKSGPVDRYLDFTSEGAVAKAGLRSAACDLFARKTTQDLSKLAPAPTFP